MNTIEKMPAYGLIGYPLGHSISPEIHAGLFALSGLRADYGLFEIAPENFSERSGFLKSLSGFNVTIPHKRRILPLLDEIDPRARRCGAVNTVKNAGGRLCGYNTDAEGFLRALDGAGIALRGRVLLCGAGGAARMMACEALERHCALTIATRDVKSAEAAADDLAPAFPGAKIAAVPLSSADGGFDLILNATPVGMYPKAGGCPLPESVIAGSAAVFDAVYNPVRTVLVNTALKAGKKAVGGLSMLVWQAAVAQEIWTGASFDKKSIAALEEKMQKLIEARYGAETL